MVSAYPACFFKEETGYTVVFPDLNWLSTCGETLEEALALSLIHISPEGMSSAERIAFYDCEENRKYYQYGTAGGWKKYGKNPVFGGDYGTCFDVSLLLEEGKEGMPVFKMWFSWRPKRAVGYTESTAGIHWENPCAVLEPLPGSYWEADEINRPAVIHHNGDVYKRQVR